MSNILIAEDDKELNDAIRKGLENEAHTVDAFFDGLATQQAIEQKQYDLILLDVMLPKKDGLSILQNLRKAGHTPVILVTAKGAEEERITGLKYGADDYVAKPFNLTELLLRVNALLRRTQAFQNPTINPITNINIDDLSLNKSLKTATISDQRLEITEIQFNILWELAGAQGKILSKSELSEKALHKPLGAYDRSIDMHISRIRKKLNTACFTRKQIVTIHGQGFCFK